VLVVQALLGPGRFKVPVGERWLSGIFSNRAGSATS